MQLDTKKTHVKEGTNLVERHDEVFHAILEHDIPILQMTFERIRLAFEGVGHASVDIDVPPRTVHNPNEAEFERVHMSCEHVRCVHTSIHQIQLGDESDDADRPPALWVEWPTDRAILRESKLARSTFAAKTTTTMTLLRDREY